MTHPAPTPCRRESGGAGATRRRRAALAALALGAALAAALLVPRPAGAGSFVVHQCTASTPGAQASWGRTAASYRGRSRCAAGDGLQVRQAGRRTAQGRYGAWTWKAPPGTRLVSVRASASLTRGGGHRGELAVTRAGGAQLRFGGRHEAFREYARRGELLRFAARLRCVRRGGCERAGADRAHAFVRGVRIRVRDRTAPRIRSVAGSLLRGRVVRGTRELEIDARDRGGGVRRLTVAASGVELAASPPLACELAGGFATRIVPCPRGAGAALAVRTSHRVLRTGPNAVAACAEDLALGGRVNRGCERHLVWIDNECPATGPGGRELTARVRGGGARVTVASNRRPFVTGRLRDEAGRPVRGATICALTRTRRPGAAVKLAVTRRTGAGGRYRLPLPPGPSRSVFIHHANGDRVASRHGLAIRSRARPTLRIRAPRRPRRGDLLRFRGRIPGPGCAGRTVELEAGIGRGGWQVFRTARASRRCRYRAAYRLRATTGPVRYRFRARVRRQPGYPFAAGTSPVRRQRAG